MGEAAAAACSISHTLQGALTTSVSFGRFLTGEKWSPFTQTRILEDVKKYSTPGTVAEKKAFFEARYNAKRAAANSPHQVPNYQDADLDFSEITNDAGQVEENNRIDIKVLKMVF